jgi:hypothetical protein
MGPMAVIILFMLLAGERFFWYFKNKAKFKQKGI